jgi:hypothetical protein
MCMVTLLEKRARQSEASNSRAAAHPADEPDGLRCEQGRRRARPAGRRRSSCAPSTAIRAAEEPRFPSKSYCPFIRNRYEAPTSRSRGSSAIQPGMS